MITMMTIRVYYQVISLLEYYRLSMLCNRIPSHAKMVLLKIEVPNIQWEMHDWCSTAHC